MDEKEVFVIYYDLNEVTEKMDIEKFIDDFAIPIMNKFEEANKCAIMLPKDLMSWRVMSKKEALHQIEEVKEYIEAWE